MIVFSHLLGEVLSELRCGRSISSHARVLSNKCIADAL